MILNFGAIVTLPFFAPLLFPFFYFTTFSGFGRERERDREMAIICHIYAQRNLFVPGKRNKQQGKEREGAKKSSSSARLAPNKMQIKPQLLPCVREGFISFFLLENGRRSKYICTCAEMCQENLGSNRSRL